MGRGVGNSVGVEVGFDVGSTVGAYVGLAVGLDVGKPYREIDSMILVGNWLPSSTSTRYYSSFILPLALKSARHLETDLTRPFKHKISVTICNFSVVNMSL